MLEDLEPQQQQKKKYIKTAREVAMDLLARREHARAELLRKLSQRGFEPQACHQTLDKLEADGLLSEQRFVEAFIQNRIATGKGPLRIRAELQQRQVAEAEVDHGLQTCEADWSSLARQVWAQKFSEPPADAKERAKQQRFLAYRGFTAEHFRGFL